METQKNKHKKLALANYVKLQNPGLVALAYHPEMICLTSTKGRFDQTYTNGSYFLHFATTNVTFNAASFPL